MKYYHAVYLISMENGATQLITATTYFKGKLTAKKVSEHEGYIKNQCHGAKGVMLLNLIRIAPIKREGK